MVIIFLTVFLLLLTRITTVYLINKKNSFYTDGDAIGHLNYIKEIYKNHGKIPDKLEKYILDYNDYPNGFHKLFYLLKIPVNLLEKFGGYIPTLLDLCLLIFTTLFIHLFGGDNYLWLLAFPFLRLFIANEGRSSHFSERSYGVLWGNIFLGSIIAYYLNADIIWLITALISFFVFSVSSKFAWQATFFITLLLSLFEQTLFFIAIYLIAFAISIILSHGYSYKVLKGLIRHSIFYKTYLSKKYFGLANHYKNFLTAFGKTSIRQKIMLFMTNSVFRLISDNPLHIAVIFLMFTQAEWSIFYSFALSGILLVLLISLESLKFLGEPERYIEFSIIPIFIILSQTEVPYIVTIITTIAIAGTYFLHSYLFIRTYKAKNTSSKDMEDIITFLKTKKDKIILTSPLRLSFFLGYFSDNNKFITYFSNIGCGQTGEDYKDLIPDYYPYPGRDLNQYITKYNVNYLVVEKNRVKALNSHIKEQYYSFDNYSIVHDNENYTVYKV